MKKIFLILAIFLIFIKPALADEPDNLLVILDCSMSMDDKINGQSKIDIAKNSIRSVLAETPPEVNIGLRVYGHKRDMLRSVVGLDKCEISELLVPIGPNNREYILEQINKLHPVGWTPICYSLEQAFSADFNNIKGRKRIVLVSDGMETCSGNPCNMAIKLMKQYPDITINAIGLDVSSDPAAINNLRCVALVSHGKFFIADNTEQFLRSLKESFNFSREVEGRIIGK